MAGASPPDPDLRACTAALSLVAFKRLAGRPRDQLDLLELEARHGSLPHVRLRGVDP